MNSSPKDSRFLERALLFTIACHIVAMVSLVIFLLPGLPSETTTIEQRATFISQHPFQWRLGWIPWQVTALSDLVLSFALFRTRWVPKAPAFIGLALTLVAIGFEQPAEFRWITTGVDLAHQAVSSNSMSIFAYFEAETFRATSLWAAFFYTLAAITWSLSLEGGRTWNRWLAMLSVVLWPMLIVVSLGPLLKFPINLTVISACNGLGFVIMLAWFAIATELVMRRSITDTTYGKWSPWRSSSLSIFAKVTGIVANSRLLSHLGEWMPKTKIISDISNVVYINFLVDAEKLRPLLPAGLELETIGPDDQFSVLSILVMQHNHCGPAFMRPLRRLFPSPIQSNWRLYAVDPRTSVRGVYFLTTTMSQVIPALGARTFSDSLPMHIPAHSTLIRSGSDRFQASLEPGSGSSPDLDANLKTASSFALYKDWQKCFDTPQKMLEYLVPQDRSITTRPWANQIVREEINFDVPIDQCFPLIGAVTSTFVSNIVGESTPLCFYVPNVSFAFTGQIVEKL
ncbi:MAG: DUF2071 domain-containing protein [Armatimonadota bacterium]